MRSHWQFKVILSDLKSFFVRRADGSNQVDGTPEEALEFAARVRKFYEDRAVLRVEAHATGPMDLGEHPALSPKVFYVRPHGNGHDWLVDEGSLAHPAWLTKLEHAISLLAFRSRGYITLIQILDPAGLTARIVLIDQRNDDCFRNRVPTGVESLPNTVN
jgi:hypothetical protein